MTVQTANKLIQTLEAMYAQEQDSLKRRLLGNADVSKITYKEFVTERQKLWDEHDAVLNRIAKHIDKDELRSQRR